MVTRRRATMGAAMALAAALLAAPATAEQYALLCGCAVYDEGPNLKPADLPTTANDVLSLYEVLVRRFGFKPGNIRVLLSPPEQWPLQPPAAGPATSANIAESFASWFARAGPDDSIFFAYSGHGTFLHYTGGGADIHEEALLGSDYARTDPPQVLTFSQLRWLHSRLRDGQSVFVIDACHSGGGALAMDVLRSPFGPEPPIRYSATEPETRPVATPALVAAGLAPQIGPEDLAAIQRRTVTVTACQSWEVASGVGPELPVGGQLRQTGMLTGSLVRALTAGPENQSWDDIARTARFLSVLGCIGQTTNAHGQGLGATPFAQPTASPAGPPYYVAVPHEGALVMPADPFLGAGSALAVYGEPRPVGTPVAPSVTLEAPPEGGAMARLAGTTEAGGPRAAVARLQQIALPKLRVCAQAADPLGLDLPDESRGVRERLGAAPYVQLSESARDPGTDYRMWVSIEEENVTRPFARARAADFPCRLAHGRPAARSLEDSVTWLLGMLHYLRAVQGAAWLRNHGHTFRVSVTPDRDRPLYLPGATVKLKLEASAPCHVVVVAADTTGRVVVLPPQAISPAQAGEATLTLPTGGPPHDMRLAVAKVFAFARPPEAAAVVQVAAGGKTDPAQAMLELLRTTLGGASPSSVPTEGWADSETFVAAWDRVPLSAPLEF